MSKKIQEGFGERAIAAFRDFARSDLPHCDELERTLFAHVGEQDLRRNLAETLYGSRWIYKLGLALLVKDEEQLAHVRSQIVDYSAVCEGLLSAMILHSLHRGILAGQKYQYKDIRYLRNHINWNVRSPLAQLNKRNFYWIIEIAREENIVSGPLADRLHKMRKLRNTVHLRERTQKSFIGTSRNLFQTVLDTCAETQAWKGANP